jgi:drug/metabolite transporter (DMT)-like permease
MALTPRLALMLAVPPLMWAGNAIVGRLLVGSSDPLWLNAWRWIVAFALLLPLGWRAIGSAAARGAIRERWRYLAVLGLFGVGAYNALQYLALRTSTPLNVTLIASSSPVWALAIGAIFYGVHPTRRQLIGAVLSLLGVALVMVRGDPAALSQIRLVEGDLLMLLAILGWSTYSWMLARPPAHMRGDARPAWNWAEFLVAQSVFGVVWATAAAGTGDLLGLSQPMQWTLPVLLAILFVAVGPSIIAYRIWGLAVQEAGPALASIFYNLTPLFAALFSAAIIGEWPRPYHGVAFALIVGGIAVSSQTRPESRQ